MKKLTFIFAATIVVLFFTTGNFAQEEGHYYTVTTWKFEVPEGGSMSELTDLLQEWQEKVTFKNDKIVSERVIRHQSGSDMRDWVFISEYANWNDIDAANDVQSKLVEEGWPDKDERKKFFDAFWSYVETHSDEIFQELPSFRK